MAPNELDIATNISLEFKAKTISEDGYFTIPLGWFGLIPAFFTAAVITGINGSDISGAWESGVYLWSLTPFLNALVFWPDFYKESMERTLNDKGHKQKVAYGTALKSWYRMPFISKKKVLQKSYVKIHPSTANSLHGNLENFDVSMGEATHEVTDYLVSDAKGLRMERQVEPTPLMLWKDALNTVDEGFGLKKIYQ